MNYEIFALPFDHVINTEHTKKKKIFMNSPTSSSNAPNILLLYSFLKKLEFEGSTRKEGGKVNAIYNTRD